MKKRITKIVFLSFSIIAITLLIGRYNNWGKIGHCTVKYYYSKAVVLKTTMSKDSLNFGLAYKLNNTTSFNDNLWKQTTKLKDTMWEQYNRNYINIIDDEFNNFAKLKVNDTITFINCQILKGSCAGSQKISTNNYPYKNDTIIFGKEK